MTINHKKATFVQEADVVCESLIPGISSDAAAIAIFIGIGFVVGAILTSLIFLIRQRKTRKVDHEFRERFGSPLAGVGNNNNLATSQQQQDVSLLLYAAAAPAYPEPTNNPFIPQKPPLLPKTMDTLSKAGPLGYSVTSLRDSVCFSEGTRTQNNQTEDPAESKVFIPAYFGAAQSSSNPSSSSSGNCAGTSARSTVIGTASGLDASASVIIREEGPPNASNAFRSPFTQRKECAQEKGEKVEQVAPPPIFISPSKGLSNIGPLARSVSNLQIPSTVKSCATEIDATTKAAINTGSEVPTAVDPGIEEKKEEDINKARTISTIEEYENPFATTSAAKAAHKHALLELEAAAKQQKSFVPTKAAAGSNLQGSNAALPEVVDNNNNSKAISANYNKPGTKVTPKRGMAGIKEVAQVLDKKLETATLATSSLDSSLGGGVGGDANGHLVPKEGEEKDTKIVHVDESLRKSTLPDRSLTPSKEKAE